MGDSNGASWCPDCVIAEPVVNKCLEKAPEDSHYLYVGVGDRAFWKDPNCIFRTHKDTQLKSVPTLSSGERLRDFRRISVPTRVWWRCCLRSRMGGRCELLTL